MFIITMYINNVTEAAETCACSVQRTKILRANQIHNQYSQASATLNWIIHSILFRCIIPVVCYAIEEVVGTSKHNFLCILFIMLTTKCFGHCGPSSGHKNV